jgi:hypothetical protein
MISLELLERSFDHLLAKAIKTPHRFIGENSLNIKDIQFYKAEYLKQLDHELKNDCYTPSVLKRITVVTDKERRVFQFPLRDLIVHNVFALTLKEKIEPYLSDNLFSYRKGKNSHQALNRVVQKIRNYKKIYTGPLKSRGLYVIRKDISKYTDYISTAPQSILLNQMWSFMQKNNIHISKSDKALIVKILNPHYIEEEKQSQSNPHQKDLQKNIQTFHFLPTGSPLVTVLANFYLNELDHNMSALTNSLYIRFGDDILFVTDSKQQFIIADEILIKTCEEKELTFNAQKSTNYFINSAGRTLKEDLDLTIKGCHCFDYLGARISFDSGLELKTSKKNQFFSDLKKYLKNLSLNLKYEYGEDWYLKENNILVFVQAINEMLDIKSAFYIRYLDFIMFNISDRHYFRLLDNEISYEVLKMLKPKQNAIFSSRPYRVLREQFGLKRLESKKNHLYDNN